MPSLMSLEQSQTKRILNILDDTDKANHLIFRLLGPNFQQKFSSLIDIEKIPKVFIHGNPHLDNYARTFTGAGMVDFDRSRIGPYAWDIIRFQSSLALRGENTNNISVSKKVIEYFLEGYLFTFNNPDTYYHVPLFVRTILPKEEEMTMKNYLKSNHKWAKKMRKNPIASDNKKINEMLKLYLESRNETNLLKFYEITEAGESLGSLGKNHYLISLSPKSNDKSKDSIMIDLKETYNEQDTDYFYNPCKHHGRRMIKACNLYAPGVEQRLGYFTYDNIQYWGREIPSFNAKVKNMLTDDQMQELAYCVGSQLGRGHRRSLRETKPKNIIKHYLENKEIFKSVSELINREVMISFDYLNKTHQLEKEFTLQ